MMYAKYVRIQRRRLVGDFGFEKLDNLYSLQLPANQDALIAESRGKPFVVKFGGRARETVGVDDKHLTYAQYSQDLQAEGVPCEWAPFSSRVDWEIARWAKLRGPSSTALSELLGIDGVCQCIICH